MRATAATAGAQRSCPKMPAMYDHNQTLIPDSFMALYAVHGRPTASRAETEARYEFCENLAVHTAAFLATQPSSPEEVDELLRRCHRGLLGEPAAVSPAEARWVVCRVAELQEWPSPAWPAEDPDPPDAGDLPRRPLPREGGSQVTRRTLGR